MARRPWMRRTRGRDSRKHLPAARCSINWVVFGIDIRKQGCYFFLFSFKKGSPQQTVGRPLARQSSPRNKECCSIIRKPDKCTSWVHIFQELELPFCHRLKLKDEDVLLLFHSIRLQHHSILRMESPGFSIHGCVRETNRSHWKKESLRDVFDPTVLCVLMEKLSQMLSQRPPSLHWLSLSPTLPSTQLL